MKLTQHIEYLITLVESEEKPMPKIRNGLLALHEEASAYDDKFEKASEVDNAYAALQKEHAALQKAHSDFKAAQEAKGPQVIYDLTPEQNPTLSRGDEE